MKNRKPTNGGYKKGQAVMEYLITYGLALFVILIVLAILVAVVLPSLQAPETCQFTQPGFGCSTKKHVLVADEDNEVMLLFQLDNQQGKSIIVTGVHCSESSAANLGKDDVPRFEAGDHVQMVGGSSHTYNVSCFMEDGTTRVTLAPNSNFQGSIGVTYNFQDEVEGAPERLAVGTVTGNIQAE